jgi:gephyrin
MGSTDLFKPLILSSQLQGVIHFGRVAVKPGKPTTFAQVDKKAVFALPGNPASALVMFYVFVLPALRLLGGWEKGRCELPVVKVKIEDRMKLDSRTEFHRVIVSVEPSSGKLLARSTGGQRSSRIASLSGANGFIILPRKEDSGKDVLDVGQEAECLLIGELRMM